MSCRTVQNSVSALLDGCLSDQERRSVLYHLRRCPDCELRLARMAQLREALKRLPAARPPAYLDTALRAMASRERLRRMDRRGPVDRFLDSVHLWADNLMRPLALPFAGGLASALLLFSMLMPGIAASQRYGGANDVPVALFTEPAVKWQMPFAYADDQDEAFVVEVITDPQGRMVDYTPITPGRQIAKDPALRRAIENSLLFTEFRPATQFGRPTYGRMYLSFRNYQINIRS